MKCMDCKNYVPARKSREINPVEHYCSWHEAELKADVMEEDSAEKDCLGFERKA